MRIDTTATSQRIAREAAEASVLPCPFCGSPAEIAVPGVALLDYAASVICTECKAVMFGYGASDATEAWNRRDGSWTYVEAATPEPGTYDVAAQVPSVCGRFVQAVGLGRWDGSQWVVYADYGSDVTVYAWRPASQPPPLERPLLGVE